MNILITGGAGFVGSNLAINLKRKHKNWEIYAFDNLKRRGSELNIPRLKDYGINFIHGDIRNREDFFLFKDKKIDVVLECSAEPSVLSGYDGNSFYIVNTNLIGLVNCLELCKEIQSDIIFLSTSRVYPYKKLNEIPYKETDTRFIWADQNFQNGISEKFSLDGPKTLYGTTKITGEYLVQEYAEMFNFKFIINRFSVIGGPWQFGKVDQGVFTLWMLAHYFKKSLKYIGFGGKGKQVRDVIHINDVCDLIEMEILNLDKLNAKIYNAGGGVSNSLSLFETTKICEEITGNKIEIGKDLNDRPGDVRIYITDNAKIIKETNWNLKYDKKQVLIDIFEWIRKNEEFLKKSLDF